MRLDLGCKSDGRFALDACSSSLYGELKPVTRRPDRAVNLARRLDSSRTRLPPCKDLREDAWMTLRSTASRWGTVSRFFHWGMFLLLAGMVPFGLYMTTLPLGVPKLRMYALHKSVGLTLLALAGARLLWRSAERRPLSPPMPPWQARAATAAHVVLYALMFAVPLTGWLFNSAAGFPLQWFGWLNLPALTQQNPALKSLARELHETGVWVLVGVVALHAAAAIKHHFIDHDRTLSQMLPGVKPPANGANA